MFRKIRDNIYSTLFDRKYWSLSDFKIKKIYKYDDWNLVKNGEIEYYLYNSDICIGYFNLRLKTGQIGIAVIDKEYRGYGVGLDLVKKLSKDKNEYNGNTELFAVTSENHPFWKKLPNSKYKTPADNSISGGGYRFNLYSDK
jgi:hypothetical protein